LGLVWGTAGFGPVTFERPMVWLMETQRKDVKTLLYSRRLLMMMMMYVECGLSTVHCCLFSEREIKTRILCRRWRQVVEWASRDPEPEWRTWSSSSHNPFS